MKWPFLIYVGDYFSFSLLFFTKSVRHLNSGIKPYSPDQDNQPPTTS